MKFKLIIKKLNETLSEEEEIIFSEWYNESSSHRKYFNSVKQNYNKKIENIDVEKGWLRLQERLSDSKPKVNYWKYAAAAASIVVLISVGFLFNKKETSKAPSIVDVNNSIQIGTDKAILTLEDGSSIELGKGKIYEADNYKSSGEELVYTAQNNSDLEIVYNYLTIPRGGQFYIKLADGTEVWLNSESQIKYPVEFKEGKSREVELVYGEAYFDVSPSTNHNGSKFKVINQNQVIEVLGTEFNVKAYKEEENIYTTLVEGKVTVGNSFFKENLIPNQQSKLNIKSNDVSVKTVETYNETSWRKGFFSFKSKSLKEIMVVLSRWYNIEIEFENTEVEKVKFNGVLSKRDKIEEILKSIKNTKFITDYEIANKKITIK